MSPDEGRHSQRQILAPKVSLLVGALFCFVCVYPGFHIGLCPHFTLGFAGVPCLKTLVISLNFDALALTSKVQCTHRNKYDVLTFTSTAYLLSKSITSGDRCTVSKRTSFTCAFVRLCRMRQSQGIETEGAGSLLL